MAPAIAPELEKRRLQWRRQWRLKSARWCRKSRLNWRVKPGATAVPAMAPETGEIVCQTIRMITQAREDLTWNGPLLCANPKIIKRSITLRSSSCLLRTQGYRGTIYRIILMALRQWCLQWRQKTASNGAWKRRLKTANGLTPNQRPSPALIQLALKRVFCLILLLFYFILVILVRRINGR